MNTINLMQILFLFACFRIYSMQLPIELKGTLNVHCQLIQSDNKILVLAARKYSNFADIALIRYNADSSLDKSFASKGGLTASDGRSIILKPVLLEILDDEKILVTSLAADHTRVQHCYLANGSVDWSFGDAGILRAKP